MYRKALESLKLWESGPNRKPLIIRGARQVGKSTLVRLFAKNYNLTLIELNFEEDPSLKTIFSSNDVHSLLQTLEVRYHTHFDPKTTLLFLDEIQAHPPVLQLLRYFYEKKPEIKIVAAGSLLEFLFYNEAYSVPVGRIEYLFLGPMTFEEFLHARGNFPLLELLNSCSLASPLSEGVHHAALEELKIYMTLGGMPAVVQSFIEEKSFLAADRISHSIINTYREDFNKYKKQVPIERLEKVFSAIPTMVGQKLVYSHIDPRLQAREVESTISLLEKALIIHRIWHTSSDEIPLGAGINKKISKPLYLDLGIMNTILNFSIADFSLEENIMYAHRGSLSEQFVGQHLLSMFPWYQKPELFYWCREKSQSSAEIDYLIAHKRLVVPIEVKSGATGTLRSLHYFMQLRKSNLAVRFNVDRLSTNRVRCATPGSEHFFELLSIPLYLIEQTHRLISANNIL